MKKLGITIVAIVAVMAVSAGIVAWKVGRAVG